MVARVVSKNVVKFDIVNLVVGLRLEPLEYDREFFIADLELHGVEDGSESGVRDEPTLALVFVLEERLDQ